jgi:hypothetical protein
VVLEEEAIRFEIIVMDSLSDNIEKFNEILLTSVDKTITEVLSPEVCAAFYAHLRGKYNITRDEIPYRLDSLYKILDEIFGPKPARTIERQIAKHLCAEFNIHFVDAPDSTLQRYVHKAKQLGR